MKTYNVGFEENGDEYTGWLKVTCNKIKKIGNNTFMADNVMVEIDEKITEIEEDVNCTPDKKEKK